MLSLFTLQLTMGRLICPCKNVINQLNLHLELTLFSFPSAGHAQCLFPPYITVEEDFLHASSCTSSHDVQKSPGCNANLLYY